MHFKNVDIAVAVIFKHVLMIKAVHPSHTYILYVVIFRTTTWQAGKASQTGPGHEAKRALQVDQAMLVKTATKQKGQLPHPAVDLQATDNLPLCR